MGNEATTRDEKVSTHKSLLVFGRKPKLPNKDAENVCFICLQGGDLVVCARMDCPKVYHTSCIGRGDSFDAKRWNCSWHLCKICEKIADYMCYTCSQSICKGCIKEDQFSCVRGNNGFCKFCAGTVALIEKNEKENKAQVDFNDRSSWEYLFKDYWIDLKGKLYFTSDELTQVINAFKGAILLVSKEQSADGLDNANDDQVSKSGSSSEHLEVSSCKRRKVIRCSNSSTQDGSSCEARSSDTEWACKELLDFVAHMKNGDTSVLSHFNVRALLLEYIARNNLRDPHQKSQILCDSRLENLFGKACIGHFEMFSYLRSHLIRKDTQADYIQVSLSDAKPRKMETRGNSGPLSKVFADKIGKMCKMGEHISPETNNDDYAATVVHLETKSGNEPSVRASADKRLKIRKTGEHRSPQTNLDYAAINIHLMADGNSKPMKKAGSYRRPKLWKKAEHRSLQTNLHDYAAIDVHNIKLLHLRRNLLEDLLEDVEKFHDKVVGSFVRIRIDSSEKQEIHRLVQVVGTGRMLQPYKTGKKTTDITLEILNLSKTEIIKIVSVSNEEFSEDECTCLREGVKSGFISQLVVGEVQEKAMALQEARVDDWLEKERLRLSNLCARASEKGRRKEFRECLDNLQLLSNPEERLRRVQEIPEIHPELNMNPSNENQEDAESDNYMGQRCNGFNSKAKKPIAPKKGGPVSNITRTPERRVSFTASEPSRNMMEKCVWDKGDLAIRSGERTDGSSLNEERDNSQTGNGEEFRNQVAASVLDTGTWNSQVGAGSGPASETVPPYLAIETDKLWHYRDPSGKVQGPFSMLQLCKWSRTVSFPANMRIWRTMEMQEDSILLIDALDNTFSRARKVTAMCENRNLSKLTDHHDTGMVFLSSQLTLSSISSPTSRTFEPDESSQHVSPLASHLLTNDDIITSSSYLPSLTLVEKGVRDLFQDSKNNLSISQHGLSRKSDPGICITTSPAVSQEMTSHTDDPRAVSQVDVLIPLTQSAPCLNRSEVNGETIPHDTFASKSETQGFVEGITSLNDLLSPTAIQDSKNNLSSSQHGLSPKPDSGICITTSPAVSQEMTSHTGDPHAVSQVDVLIPLTQSGPCPLKRSEVNGEAIPCDIVASMSETHGFVEGITSLNDLLSRAGIQESKNNLSSSQHGLSPKSDSGIHIITSPAVSQEMTSQYTWMDDPHAVSQVDVLIPLSQSEPCPLIRSEVNGETSPNDILGSMSVETQGFVLEPHQPALDGDSMEVRSNSVISPSELASGKLPNENQRRDSLVQQSERDPKFGSESLVWRSAPVQKTSGGPASGKMTMGWGTNSQERAPTNQDLLQLANVNNGLGGPAGATMWGSHLENTVDGFTSHQSFSSERNVHNGWGEQTENTTSWGRLQENNGNRFSGHQRSSYKGNANKRWGECAGNTTPWGRHEEENEDRFSGHQSSSYKGSERAANTTMCGRRQENDGDRYSVHQRSSYKGHVSNEWGQQAGNTTNQENNIVIGNNGCNGSNSQKYASSDSGHNSVRSHGNKQSTFAGGGQRGGSSTSPFCQRGQLCRFYRRGWGCRKGKSCNYIHEKAWRQDN